MLSAHLNGLVVAERPGRYLSNPFVIENSDGEEIIPAGSFATRAEGEAWLADQFGRDAEPSIPGSKVVRTTLNCEVLITPAGFYARCTATGCTYVSRITPARHIAVAWANAHDEDQPNDGRES